MLDWARSGTLTRGRRCQEEEDFHVPKFRPEKVCELHGTIGYPPRSTAFSGGMQN